ncbi:unnamed protein product [Prorocentrum cordatum]|uniref:Pentacotripeptide-repeat region of PRORP domain-containing protein n=1 Tax=Prorocentrum cordatum TaxID=2364126 RepID=A0ABN9UYD5_9DINO|nr:unnamed protein product [Polarella glacialis]
MGIAPNAATWLGLVSSCVKRQQYDEAIGFLKELLSSGAELDPKAHFTIIDAYTEAGAAQDALDYFDSLKAASDDRLGPNIYRAALRACKAGKDADRALELVNEVESEYGEVTKDLYTHVAEVCQSCERWNELVAVLRDMRGAGVPVSVPQLKNTYKPALTALAQQGRAMEASALFEELIEDLSRGGQWREILVAFESVEKESRDAYTYSSTMRALVNAESPVEEVLALWERMAEDGVEATRVAHRTLIVELEVQGMWQKALDIWGEMRTKGFTPDEPTFIAVLAACEKGELWETLLDVFEESKSAGFSVAESQVVARSVISACEKTGQEERRQAVVEESQRLADAKRAAIREAKAKHVQHAKRTKRYRNVERGRAKHAQRQEVSQ